MLSYQYSATERVQEFPHIARGSSVILYGNLGEEAVANKKESLSNFEAHELRTR